MDDPWNDLSQHNIGELERVKEKEQLIKSKNFKKIRSKRRLGGIVLKSSKERPYVLSFPQNKTENNLYEEFADYNPRARSGLLPIVNKPRAFVHCLWATFVLQWQSWMVA